MSTRAARTSGQNAKIKTADRLAAARSEHDRRRAEQVDRHEIRAQPQVGALLLAAERDWRTCLGFDRDRRWQEISASYAPRARRWSIEGAAA